MRKAVAKILRAVFTCLDCNRRVEFNPWQCERIEEMAEVRGLQGRIQSFLVTCPYCGRSHAVSP